MFDIPAPDQSAAAQLRVNPLIVRIALSEVSAMGGDPLALCADLGFVPSDLDDPQFRLSYLQASRVIRRMCGALQDSEHSLRAGLRHHLVSSGLVGLAAMAADTLRDAALLALRFQEQAGSLLLMDIEAREDHAILHAMPRFSDVAIAAPLVDGTFAALVCAARQLCGAEFKPRAVEFVKQQPSDITLHLQIFQCPVRFGCTRNRMLIDQGWWTSKVTSGDPNALKRIVSLLESSSTARPKMLSLETVIETHLRDGISQPPSLAELAKLLGTSERTLRRKLSDAGRSYGDMLDRARKTRALELIAHSHCTIREIAEEVGFNDPRSLRRAFKRWTGRTLASAMASVAAKRNASR